METLKTGDLAYYDSATQGLVPCRVLAVSGKSGICGTGQRVRVKMTAERGQAFVVGYETEAASLYVIPRKSVYVPRGCIFPRVRPYLVQCD
jgi:hypothetical protein